VAGQSVSVQLLGELLFFRNCHKHGRWDAGKVEPIPSLYQLRRLHDGVADPDERLNITGVQSGTYDIKLADKEGRTCMVQGVKVEAGQIFSIDDKELTSCNR